MGPLLYPYRYVVYPLAKKLMPLAALTSPKIKKGLELRQKNGGKPWLDFEQNSQPVWIHCASGEFEYAAPVIRALRKQQPDIKIMVTYFSPSIVNSIRNTKEVDFYCPLPWDSPQCLREFIDFHNPRALLISRTDLWPEMLNQVQQAKIPSLLFSRTVNAGKTFIQKELDSMLLNFLNEIFVVSEIDKDLLVDGRIFNKITVVGDTRYDQCLYRLSNPKKLKTFSESEKPVVLLASIWESDERVVLATSADMQKEFNFIVVPHEPVPRTLKRLQEFYAQNNITTHLYSEIDSWDGKSILIVDIVGILADLYARCDFAYVGGSFGRGVHSVMEPLAQGKPCFVGPNNKNNREAWEFQRCEVEDDLCPVREIRSSKEFYELLARYKKDWKEKHSEQLRKLFLQKAGATKKVVNWVIEKQRPTV